MNKLLTTIVLLMIAASAAALEISAPVPVEVGGRLEYDLRLRRDGSSFPWNYATGGPADRTRLMLDLLAGEERTGWLYLKSAAPGSDGSDPFGNLNFGFDQGDYHLRRQSGRSFLEGRAYINERRLFTYGKIAPLLNDDLGGTGRDNHGLRLDGSWRGRFGLTGLYAGLGDDFDKAVRIGFTRMEYTHSFFSIAAAYFHEDRPEASVSDRKVAKGELAVYYRPLTLLVSWQQSDPGYDEPTMDNAAWPQDYVPDEFHWLAPDDGAMFAEARWRALQLGAVGRLHWKYQYSAVGPAFYGRRTDLPGGMIEHKSGIYFTADSSAVSGRLEYVHRERQFFELSDYQHLEAGAWAGLRGGSEAVLRLGISEESWAYRRSWLGRPDLERNYLHGGYIHRIKNLKSGFYLRLEDLDTGDSRRKMAWDSRMNFSGNIAVYWRAVITHNASTHRTFMARFEYRPSPRLLLTAGYGRPELGDGPFILEDPDIDTIGRSDPVYNFFVRGDF